MDLQWFSRGSVRFVSHVEKLIHRRRCGMERRVRSHCRAMVNVDLSSPSIILGITLIGAGVTLFSVRTSNPSKSRDSDVFLSSLIIVTGGAIVFQGWRLDPLLLLCQLMTCGVATAFALEALSLRDVRKEPTWQSQLPPFERDEAVFDTYDMQDEVIPDFQTSELPPPGASAEDILTGGWMTEEGEENWESKRSEGLGSLQTIEDWD